MTHPINGDFEKLVLDGCKIIIAQSLNYDTDKKDYTHILMECPKDYRIDKDRGVLKYVSLKCLDTGSWYEATEYYSTKAYAKKRFSEDLREDRHYEYLKKKNQLPTL